MDCAEVRFTYPSLSSCIKFVFVGDLHLGNKTTDEDLVRTVAKRLEEPWVYWVDLGDPCDYINISDRRFDPAMLPDWIGLRDLPDLPKVQISRYYTIFGPVADKCLMRLCGNHDEVILRKYERDVYAEINGKMDMHKQPHGCELKGTRTPGFGGFMRLRFRRLSGAEAPGSKGSGGWTLNLFLHHGAGGGQLAGAKALRLERLPMAFDADVFVVGHTHTKLVLSKRRVGMYPARMGLKHKPLVMINTGAFMRSYEEREDGYVEQRMLYPQGLGPVELWIWPGRQEIRVVQ